MVEDKLKKTIECDLPRLTRYSGEYALWWKVQIVSLLCFIVLLVLGIMGDWWLLFPGFLCLALNMFANINRMMVFQKLARSLEEKGE